MLAWQPGCHASIHPPLLQGAALRVQWKQQVHQKALLLLHYSLAVLLTLCYNAGKWH